LVSADEKSRRFFEDQSDVTEFGDVKATFY